MLTGILKCFLDYAIRLSAAFFQDPVLVFENCQKVLKIVLQFFAWPSMAKRIIRDSELYRIIGHFSS
jgi:hypothetical protein